MKDPHFYPQDWYAEKIQNNTRKSAHGDRILNLKYHKIVFIKSKKEILFL